MCRRFNFSKCISPFFFTLFSMISVFPFSAYAQNDTKTFGVSIFILNGLEGKIYFLPVNTRALPDFDTMKSSASIYIDSINIPTRSWSSGFPGLRDRFEWFGIEYKGFFKPDKSGEYLFRLLSDDGSKLFIDDSLIINNDGQHGAFSKTGKITLDDAPHSVKLQYFQSPRYQIALQLFASINNGKEEIFPGNNFQLYTQRPQNNRAYYFLLPGGVILLIILFAIMRSKKKKKSVDDKK
jgi:PA14 domain